VRSWILIALLVAACSTPEPEPVIAPGAETPEEAAAAWLNAVDTVDTVELSRIVEPTGLAVLIGVENALRSDELVAVLDAGLEAETTGQYWTSFRDDFEAIRGIAVSDLSVVPGAATPAGDGFAVVTVQSDDGAGEIVLRNDEGVGWRVDLAATVGPALVSRLGDYLDSALAGDNADAIAAAYRSGIVPGLNLAAELNPTNSDLVFGAEYIRQLAAK
jgi:hypothetical protein